MEENLRLKQELGLLVNHCSGNPRYTVPCGRQRDDVNPAFKKLEV